MPLAALISAAQAAAEEEEGLRATLPLAGATLVEHQVRLAAAAGASPIVILVERLPAALTAAVDRLRRDGLQVEIARSLADAVDRIHPEEALLVIADGCVADRDLVARFVAAVPAVLTVPDDGDHPRFERIDSTARWGGLLLIDGAQLRATAAMLGEWDLQSTLLRRAVQEAAPRMDAYAEGDTLLALIERRADLDAVDRAVVTVPSTEAADWPARFLYPLLVDRLLLPVLRRGIDRGWFVAGSMACAGFALPFVLFGWRGTALALLLLSGLIESIAHRLDEVRLRPAAGPIGLRVRLVAALAALGLLAADLAAAQGWGCWLVAALLPLAGVALLRERAILRAVTEEEGPLWLASLDGLLWSLVPGALAGSWLGALAVTAGYALASFAFVQHRVARLVGGGSLA